VKHKPPSLLRQLKPYQIKLIKPALVRRYLLKFPEIAELLPTVSKRTRRAFGPHAELLLALYRDPEFKDEYLTIYVREAPYGSDILARIDRVSQAFAKKLDNAAGNLLITTDFRAPGANDAI
jgi:hypothetical protein